MSRGEIHSVFENSKEESGINSGRCALGQVQFGGDCDGIESDGLRYSKNWIPC